MQFFICNFDIVLLQDQASKFETVRSVIFIHILFWVSKEADTAWSFQKEVNYFKRLLYLGNDFGVHAHRNVMR